ncbi:hypothetical protein KAJ38_02305, partial [Candidatus Pacearchaeota archaeon]|nr:hypothetical protein [Candidatus Pacearchaeota archaeon]
MVTTDDILKKYGSKIEGQMKNYDGGSGQTKKFSKSYKKFQKESIHEFSSYERWCKSLGNFFTLKVGEKDKAQISRAIEIAHLNVSPSEVVVFSTVLLFLTMFGGMLLFTGIWLISGAFSLMFLFFTFLFGIFLFLYSSKTPERLAMKWRLKASSQMVPAILYIVIYM